jgi:hypothetical protein
MNIFVLQQVKHPVGMGAEDHDDRQPPQPECRMQGPSEQRLTIMHQQLLGSAKPTTLAGGEQDDDGMIDPDGLFHDCNIPRLLRIWLIYAKFAYFIRSPPANLLRE